MRCLFRVSHPCLGFHGLAFRKTVLLCDIEPNTKSLREAVINAHSGAEIFPQGPPDGNHKANYLVGQWLRERVKRHCRTLRISVEQRTGLRTSDDSPLVRWLPRFAVRVNSKMTMGIDEQTSEQRRTGRRWRKRMAQTMVA